MHQQLKEKLWSYIVHNNPDLMYLLQDEYRVGSYLDEKISSIMPMALSHLEKGTAGHAIIELCMNELTEELKPSRFHFIVSILSEEFEEQYVQLRKSGLLTYEVLNMIEFCKDLFETLHFNNENEDDKIIRYAVIGKLSEYQEQKQPD